jgi:hypothetical protein
MVGEAILVGDDGGLLVLVELGEAAERVEAAERLAHTHAALVVRLPVSCLGAVVQIVLYAAACLLVQAAAGAAPPLLSRNREGDILVIVYAMTSNPKVIEVPIFTGARILSIDLLEVRRDKVTGIIVLRGAGVGLIGPEEVVQEAEICACARGR